MTFPKVNPRQSFPKMEEELISFWKEEKIFEESISTRAQNEEFNFYDGPPFATWTPHYWHILAGTIKDVIPRYQTMLWKKVDRKFGWDCHGLPIENIVEKKLNISWKDDIENKIWIHDFNETCRANVFWYVDEWKKTVERMWRWVDMENDYKTMDTPFMESVWNVFKNIYDKWLIYEGNRVVPYCPRCTTPLSNFEVNQGYKDKQSKTVTVKFKVKTDNPETIYQESTWIIVKNTEWKILLWKKKLNWLFTFPGWKTENCETPLNCIKRELLEETLLELKNEKLYSCNTSYSNWQNWKEHVYEMFLEDESLVKNPEADKFEDWKFYDINDEILNENNFEVHSYNVLKQVKWEKPTNNYHTTWNKYILAWTTTPWTLYANLGLAVWEDIDYVELLDKTNWDTYILASAKVKDYYKKETDFEILREYKWSCLAWIKYEPIFSDFEVQIREMWKNLWPWIFLWKNAWSIVLWHHVTTDTWTWIVHIAPAYWEDDFIIGEKEDLWFVAHIDNSWKTYNLLDNNWVFVFDFNDLVISELKDRKVSLHIWTVDHSYPHCWRCDTPLIYRWIPAWYVAVEKIRDKMVANNEKINWVPDVIKHGRFGKWVEWARDWNISRNRYWWSAIPVWQSEDKKQEVCIGSIEELYELNKDFGQITKVILVRHWRTDFNDLWKNDSLWRAKLNDKWIEQAQKIKDILKDKNIDLIYSSPLERCINTIFPLSNELSKEILIEDWFKEVNISKLEWQEINWKYFRENKNEKIGWWETYAEMSKRVSESYTKILEKNKWKTIVICSHWDPSYNILSHILWFEIKPELNRDIYLANKTDDINKIFTTKYVYSNTWKEIDLHKHFVDKILVKNPATWNTLKRIPEVLDCWFESWAMPYASKHFPFENSDNFKFPADFIAEWLDQTRWWFYTLLILWTALFDNTPFLNCIVNGIILAEDGKKMSKSLKNYPDPQKIFDNYWADAMRFYLMNSPVVAAEDLRFSEVWVEEVVKKVLLPLWNTYSFFTTYANIDWFKPKKTHIYYCRHGETINNSKWIMSGWDDNSSLTKKWEYQAKNTGLKFSLSWEKIDIIISSPRDRAYNTAKIIAQEIWFEWKIIQDERLNEQREWNFLWMSHDEIKKYAKVNFNIDVNTVWDIRRIFKVKKYNWIEDITEFDFKVNKFFQEINEKFEWKNILIVAHSWTYRPINKFINDLWEEAHYDLPSIPNANIFKLPEKRKNILDKWIISELNKLILEVSISLDNYKINEATRPIVSFLDNLTNWYIRRSRKRFWATWLQEDKVEAYETLYEILVELCKVLAPVMPFISEYIYKNLTWKKSVHIDIFPTANKSFILNSLNSSFDKTAKIIKLWLACRENNKLRVRQPLKSIKISENIDEYYLDMIKDELNIKEILYFSENEIPKKICKPNARLIWPKFGSDVKFIISEAKSWNFEEIEWWKILIHHPKFASWSIIQDKWSKQSIKDSEINSEWQLSFILESWEYEIAYEKTDAWWDIESWYWMVISLDTTLNQDLIEEWFARDIIRHIQESRKEAWFNVDDRIKIQLIINNEQLLIIKNFWQYIESETLSKIVSDIEYPDFEKEIEIEDLKFNLKLKK